MNKFLNIVRIILFIILILLNGFCLFFKTGFVSWSHAIYLVLLAIILVITIIDIVKKNCINNSNVYHIVSILMFLIMNVVLFRTLFDSHLFFNNSILISEYREYCDIVGCFSDSFLFEFAKDYLNQNMIYFDAMFVLLFVYRRINLGIKVH